MEISAYLDILHDSPLSTPSTGIHSAEENNSSNSIAEMMINYISGLEASFPSIVATTGRTADKLDLPSINVNDPPCLICSMPKRSDNVRAWLDNITVTQAPQENQTEEIKNENEAMDDFSDRIE